MPRPYPHPRPTAATICEAIFLNPGVSAKQIVRNNTIDRELVKSLVRRGRIIRTQRRLFIPGQKLTIQQWMAIFPYTRNRNRLKKARQLDEVYSFLFS
jgi:hypothetical protein